MRLFVAKKSGGEGGIRTHGGRKPTPVFETGALIHYATSPRLEKLLHQRAAFRLQHARANLNTMIQEIRVTDAKPARHRARSFIRCAVNQPPDTRLYQCACAHRARLDRRVNVDSGEPVVTELSGSLTKRDDFGVGGGIAVSTRAVSGNNDELVFAYNARADGHFTTCLRLTRGGQCQAHPLFIHLKHRPATIGQKEGFTQRRKEDAKALRKLKF